MSTAATVAQESVPPNGGIGSRFGLRARLLTVVILAILPAAFILIFGAVEARQRAMDAARQDAVQYVALAASHQTKIIEQAFNLMATLAQAPDFPMGRPEECRTYLAGIFERFIATAPYYSNLVVAGPTGDIYCSAIPLPLGTSVADREHFRRAMATKAPTLGSVVTSATTGELLLGTAYPIVGESGGVDGVLLTGIRLSRFADAAGSIGKPQGITLQDAVVITFDESGTVLTRQPDYEKWAGASIANGPLFAAAKAAGENAVMQSRGVDGIERIYGMRHLSVVDRGLYIAAGLGVDDVFAPANRDAAKNLVLLALATFSAIGLGWFFGDRLMLRSIGELMRATDRLAGGDFASRAPVRSEDEIGALAKAFNSMASALQGRIETQRDVEKQLRNREHRLKTIFDRSPAAIAILRLPGQEYTDVNRAWCKMLGYSREEIVGRIPDDVNIWVDPKQPHQLAADLERDGRVVDHELHLRTKSGDTVVMLSSAEIVSIDGAPHLVTSSIEVTERRDAEEKFQLAVESCPAGLIMIDAAGEIVLVNAEIERAFGYRRDELLGRPIETLVPQHVSPHHAGYRRDYLAAPADRMMGVGRDLTGLRKDGAFVPVEIGLHPLKTRNGLMVLAVVLDITERKKAEAAQRVSEHRFAQMLRASPALISITERDTDRIREVNDSFLLHFGLTRGETIGRTPSEVGIAVEDSARRKILTAAATGGVRNLEMHFTRNGRTSTLLIHSGVIEIDGVECNMLTGIDITEYRRKDEQLRQAQKMESVGQLTGGIAHDFNNLLSIVIGNLDMLGDKIGENVRARENASEALQAALQGAELTHQLLAFSRRQSLHPKVVDMNVLVSGMTKLLSRTLGEAITVKLVPSADLWPTMTDPTQVESALANLAINARDAMPNGGTLTIETANAIIDADYAAANLDSAEGAYVVLAVTDTGNGMPPDVLARVFEPFFTTKDLGKGTGLGLSMVYGFVKQSGGHVKIYSEVGVGTTVKLYLPRAVKEAAAAEDVRSQKAALSTETILVVEDNDKVRRVLVEQLESLGYTVIEAADGRSAAGVLDEGTYVDLLLTDVVMPGGMSGIDLWEIVKPKRPALRVLFTSGFTEASQRQGAGAVPDGAPFLHKPYRKTELAAKVREALAPSPKAKD